MHIFNVEVRQGNIVPADASKKRLFDKLIQHYQETGETFKITIEKISKRINQNQVQLYNAFIIKASEHFGNSFQEMEKILTRFFPRDIDGNLKQVSQWNTTELDNFIYLSTDLLAEHGFNF